MAAQPRRVLCALDAGTQSTRALLYNAETRCVVASHQLEHEQFMPQAGWVEHDPVQLFERAQACLAGVLASVGPPGVTVLGVSLSGPAGSLAD